MTELGNEIILAMADQQWAIAFHGDELVTWSPVSQRQVRLPLALFTDAEQEDDLRVTLLALVVVHGLRWEDEPRFGGGASWRN